MTPQEVKQSQDKIARLALFSRCVVLLIQAVSYNIFPNHDAQVFLYPKPADEPKFLDVVVEKLFGGLVSWDAQYFMHVAVYGYTYENTLAFFPLLPAIVNGLTALASPLLHLMSLHSLTLLAYVLVNVFVFAAAAKALFRLTCELYDDKFAEKCAALFCYNPASVFFTAPYTECLFSYLTFSAIYHCSKISPHSRRATWAAVCFTSLSTCVRSNGLLNVGFLCYFYLRAHVFTQRLFKYLPPLLLAVSFTLVPFVLVQSYFHETFCSDFETELPDVVIAFGEKNGYVFPGDYSRNNQSWCNYDIIPLSYGYVQAKYWNVGFFRYYELKQLPNFLLAAPVIYIVLSGSFRYSFKLRGYIQHLGVFRTSDKGVQFKTRVEAVFPCFVHAVALTMFCIFFVHIQVTTRMLCSASPVIYWLSAAQDNKYVKYYYRGYFFVGTVMFSKFLPWT